MSPIVISHIAIVFLDTEQPTTEDIIVNVEAFDKVEIEEHSKASGESIVVLHSYVIELEVVKVKVCRRWHP